jgi:hypothetical protein
MPPYYLYRKGKLKKVEREEPKEDDFKAYPLPICFDKYQEQSALWKRKMAIDDDIAAWQEYINSLTSIEVHPDLKLLWHEGQHLQEGKDFSITTERKGGDLYDTAIPIPVEENKEESKYDKLLETVKIALSYRDFGVLNEYLKSIGENKIITPKH